MHKSLKTFSSVTVALVIAAGAITAITHYKRRSLTNHKSTVLTSPNRQHKPDTQTTGGGNKKEAPVRITKKISGDSKANKNANFKLFKPTLPSGFQLSRIQLLEHSNGHQTLFLDASNSRHPNEDISMTEFLNPSGKFPKGLGKATVIKIRNTSIRSFPLNGKNSMRYDFNAHGRFFDIIVKNVTKSQSKELITSLLP